MRARGAFLIAAGLAAVGIAYALRKASDNIADSFSYGDDPFLPAGSYGFAPANSFDQLRSVEGFYSRPDQRAIHWDAAPVSIRERAFDAFSHVGFRIRNAFTRRRNALRSLSMACDHHIINSRPSPNLCGQPLQNPSHHFAANKPEAKRNHG